jgi:hypothetical protein
MMFGIMQKDCLWRNNQKGGLLSINRRNGQKNIAPQKESPLLKKYVQLHQDYEEQTSPKEQTTSNWNNENVFGLMYNTSHLSAQHGYLSPIRIFLGIHPLDLFRDDIEQCDSFLGCMFIHLLILPFWKHFLKRTHQFSS